MIVNSQGFKHFLNHINNQDFAYETSRMLLVLDGCSDGKYSEVGTRLFIQLFSRKEENDSVEKFESNVKEVFEDIIKMMRVFYPNQESFEKNFIMENMLFTIIACFELEDKFIVKMFGDGYIIAQNVYNELSYIKFSYGECPPYFAYTYCNQIEDFFKHYKFKTFEFDKSIFKTVGIASDGILPIVKELKHMDIHICNANNVALKSAIRLSNQSFGDDVTIAFFDSRKINLPIVNNTKKSEDINGIKDYFATEKLETMLLGEKKSIIKKHDITPQNKSANQSDTLLEIKHEGDNDEKNKRSF